MVDPLQRIAWESALRNMNKGEERARKEGWLIYVHGKMDGWMGSREIDEVDSPCGYFGFSIPSTS